MDKDKDEFRKYLIEKVLAHADVFEQEELMQMISELSEWLEWDNLKELADDLKHKASSEVD